MPLPRYHAAVSLAVAGLVVARTRRPADALPILAAGVLVDIDHLVDLRVNRRHEVPGHIILPLHAWEWVLALLSRRRRVTDNLAGGLAAHLALDQVNPAIRHPFFYWLVVRARYGFRAEAPLVDRDVFLEGAKWMRSSPGEWF